MNLCVQEPSQVYKERWKEEMIMSGCEWISVSVSVSAVEQLYEKCGAGPRSNTLEFHLQRRFIEMNWS